MHCPDSFCLSGSLSRREDEGSVGRGQHVTHVVDADIAVLVCQEENPNDLAPGEKEDGRMISPCSLFQESHRFDL